MSEDLAEWLLEQIAEDEEGARMPPPGPWSYDVGEPRESTVFSDPTGISVALGWRRDTQHIARWNPARVLAECKAKRRIIELHQPVPYESDPFEDCPDAYACDECQQTAGTYPCPTLRVLALPYRDREGYRREWAATDREA